jgi:ketose-bisphosphate aldolase
VPVVPFKDIVDPAFEHRYGVAAFNIFNDLTLEAVLAAAVELDSPVIIQTSLKTVRSVGADVLYKMVRAMADDLPVPVTLHLDHCPEREWISTCLKTGWNSVLFDGSHLDVDENARQTAEVVKEADAYGAQVEGEIETVRGVEDDVRSEDGGGVHSVEVSVRFIERTGVYAFAPAVGTAHGLYAKRPELMPDRVTQLVEVQPIPMVLHGGTGLQAEQFLDLIGRGCAKVNISTALKIVFTDTTREYLDANPEKHDPPSLFAAVRAAVKETAEQHMRMFGSVGRASADRVSAS